MIICDTNVLIELFKNNERIVSEIHKIGLDQLAVSSITTGELLYGARDKQEMVFIQKRLGLIQQIHLDTEISQQYIELMSKYALSHKISVPDALIAATVLKHEAVLFTLNKKDFQYIPGLNLLQID